jgi:hypothetical protein
MLGKRLLGMLATLGSSLDTSVQAGRGPRTAPVERVPTHSLSLLRGKRGRVKRYRCSWCWRTGLTADDFKRMHCAERGR